jgi:hypothetical protein
MGAAEDIVNAKMKKPDMGYAESVKVAEANTPSEKPVKPVVPNVPVKPAHDPELNWVQKMTKQIHDYLTRKKNEGISGAAADVAEGLPGMAARYAAKRISDANGTGK